MSTQEIANRLVELCRQGDYETCYKELYAPDVWSIEPKGAMTEKVQGLEALAEKGKRWNEMIEAFHGSSIGDPIVSGNHFALTMMTDITFKEMGRQKMDEICMYEVQDGKIVKEQFFYSVPTTTE
ncbi:MAG: nuclear transport factor 2 family protein [Bacteroidota bacterium]